MSELLTIDTTTGIFQEEVVEPLPLLGENHPMLKQVIPEYTTPLPNTPMDTLIKRMKMTMKLFGGIGLSANQCGVLHRVFILEANNGQIVACINPKVIKQSDELAKENEGCLSFPGLSLRIERPLSIDVEFTNLDGELIQATLEDTEARCFLHELDHMNGIRFVDHVGAATLHMARQKQEKLIKKVVRNKKK